MHVVFLKFLFYQQYTMISKLPFFVIHRKLISLCVRTQQINHFHQYCRSLFSFPQSLRFSIAMSHLWMADMKHREMKAISKSCDVNFHLSQKQYSDCGSLSLKNELQPFLCVGVSCLLCSFQMKLPTLLGPVQIFPLILSSVKLYLGPFIPNLCTELCCLEHLPLSSPLCQFCYSLQQLCRSTP